MTRTLIGSSRTAAGTRPAVQREIIPFGDFEVAPPFTAATTSNSGSGRYIDGTAAGSASNDNYGWSFTGLAGSGSAQFDTTTSHSGTNSLKISTTAINSIIVMTWRQRTITSAAALSQMVHKYAIPVVAGNTYMLTHWMKTTVNSGSGGSGANCRIAECTDTAVVGTFGAANVNGNTAWTKYTFSRTVAAGSKWWVPQVNISVNPSTTLMDAWFDDISITGDWGRVVA